MGGVPEKFTSTEFFSLLIIMGKKGKKHFSDIFFLFFIFLFFVFLFFFLYYHYLFWQGVVTSLKLLDLTGTRLNTFLVHERLYIFI